MGSTLTNRGLRVVLTALLSMTALLAGCRANPTPPDQQPDAPQTAPSQRPNVLHEPSAAPSAPFVRRPDPFVREAAASEAAVEAVAAGPAEALCATLRGGGPRPLLQHLGAEFRGRMSGEKARVLHELPDLATVSELPRDETPLPPRAFAIRVARLTAGLAKVERCAAKIVAFRLSRSQPPWAMAAFAVDVGGRGPDGGRLLLRARLEAELVGAAPRWSFRRLDWGPTTRVEGRQRHFRDVSSMVGLGFGAGPIAREALKAQIDARARQNLGGLGVVDWNRDGRPDLLVWNRRRALDLYLNDPSGGFIKRPSLLPPEQVGYFQLLVDLDGDGTEELVGTELARCSMGKASLSLYRRQGEELVAVSDALEFSQTCLAWERVDYQHIAAGDLDGDGLLDLFVSGHRNAHSQSGGHNHLDGIDGQRNLLFLNRGQLRFEEVAMDRGLVASRWSYVAELSDFDADGDMDVLVINDFGPNTLYRGSGSGQFSVGAYPPLTATGESMGISLADFDGDLDLDVYISNMWSSAGQRIVPLAQRELSPRRYETLLAAASGNTLFLNQGDGGYLERGSALGVHQAGWAWGHCAADIDNDGDRDLYVVNGMTSHSRRRKKDFSTFFWRQVVADAKALERGWNGPGPLSPRDVQDQQNFRGSFSGYEHNSFFANVGLPAGFIELGYVLGLDLNHDGRAVAPLDMDGDGDLDLAVHSLQGLRLLENRGAPSRHFVRVQLKAKTGPAEAWGARVIIQTKGHKQLGRVALTEGFHTQVQPTLHFGLGDAERVEALEIVWPSGRRDRHADLPADRLLTVVEGESPPSVAPIPSWPETALPGAGGEPRLDLVAPDLKGQPSPLGAGDTPTVINFWAPWCKGCLHEAPALAKIASRRGGAVSVIGVSVETKDLPSIRRFAKKHRLSYPLRLATDAVMAAFFGPGGAVSLPSTFVFDGTGRLRRVFQRPLDYATLDGLLSTLLTPVSAEDWLVLAEARAMAGQAAEAVEAAEQGLILAGEKAGVWERLAGVYILAGDMQRAYEAARTTIRLDSQRGTAWLTMSEALTELGRAEEAADAYNKGVLLLSASGFPVPGSRPPSP